jgi:hypothetical protein
MAAMRGRSSLATAAASETLERDVEEERLKQDSGQAAKEEAQAKVSAAAVKREAEAKATREAEARLERLKERARQEAEEQLTSKAEAEEEEAAAASMNAEPAAVAIPAAGCSAVAPPMSTGSAALSRVAMAEAMAEAIAATYARLAAPAASVDSALQPTSADFPEQGSPHPAVQLVLQHGERDDYALRLRSVGPIPSSPLLVSPAAGSARSATRRASSPIAAGSPNSLVLLRRFGSVRKLSRAELALIPLAPEPTLSPPWMPASEAEGES